MLCLRGVLDHKVNEPPRNDHRAPHFLAFELLRARGARLLLEGCLVRILWRLDACAQLAVDLHDELDLVVLEIG